MALNSYRGSGGGGHLSYACGLEESELGSKMIESTDKDLRYFMIRWLEKNKEIDPDHQHNWKIIPEDWVEARREFEYQNLFN